MVKPLNMSYNTCTKLLSPPCFSILVLAIFKYGRYSWRPWLISLIVESSSQAAIHRSFTSPYGSTKSTMTALEKAELSRRFHQMWYNILRGQFYERFTR